MKTPLWISILFLANLTLFAEEKFLNLIFFNQTKSQPTKVETLELIEITEEGMKPLYHFDSVGPTFSFTINQQKPFLIRVTYKGESYSMFLTEKDINQKLIKKRIDVFDTTSEIKKISIHSGMQILKNENGLEINLIYAIQNQDNKAILPEGFYFSIPDNAKNIRSTLNYQFSQIPIRVNLREVEWNQKKYYKIDKAIKPGNSELIVQFEIDGYNFSNSIDPIWKKLNSDLKKPFFRVFMWKPSDLTPKLLGGKIEKKQLQNLEDAYFIYYESDEIYLDFQEGGFIYSNPMKLSKNPFFDTTLKTTVALILGLLLTFLIVSLFPFSKMIPNA